MTVLNDRGPAEDVGSHGKRAADQRSTSIWNFRGNTMAYTIAPAAIAIPEERKFCATMRDYI